MQSVYSGIKEPSKWGFQGVCNPAPRGSFTSALSGALALCRDQQEKPLQHLISVFRQGIFKTTISLYLYLLRRSSSPLPAVFVPLVALEGHSYTLCVPGLWQGWAEESQTEPCTAKLFSSCFFIKNIKLYTELLLSVCPSVDFVFCRAWRGGCNTQSLDCHPAHLCFLPIILHVHLYFHCITKCL